MGLDVTGRYRYPPPDHGWLAQSSEPVIDADLPIIDAHHHIWEEAGHPYLLDDLLDDMTDGHNVVATVMVQAGYGYRADGPEAHRPVGETEKIAELVSQARARGLRQRPCAAIVAHADLTLKEQTLGAVLDDHQTSGQSLLRGIRHGVSYDSHFPDGIVIRPAQRYLLADPAFRRGLAMLAPRGLSFDTMLYHQQLPELTAMARALPDLAIVLDHYGAPLGVGPYEGKSSEVFAQWRSDLADLATCPNVTIKLGGLGLIITGARWHEAPEPPSSTVLAAAWQPWFDETVRLFGADRCMFESNFPVDKAMCSYRTLWNAFKRLSSGAGAGERAALFHDTAARFYRI